MSLSKFKLYREMGFFYFYSNPRARGSLLGTRSSFIGLKPNDNGLLYEPLVNSKARNKNKQKCCNFG